VGAEGDRSNVGLWIRSLPSAYHSARVFPLGNV